MKTKLRLKKLIISGEKYKRTLDIDESLILIKGDGFSGKSLVLNLIAYCLGSKSELIDLTVQKELSDYCDEVFLEIKAGEKNYTINRNLKHDRNIISIYLCKYNEYKEYSPWRKKVDDANDFFAEEFQIPLHFILRKKSGTKDLNQEKLSFRDFMRFVFIHQGELGTNQFLQHNNTFISGKNKEIFKIINDLVIPDLEEINKSIQVNQNELNKLEKINDGLEDYLDKREAVVLEQLIANRDEIQNKINNLNDDKKAVIKKNRNSKSEIYSDLKKDIREIDEQIFEKNSILSTTELSIKNKEILLIDYNEEKSKLMATLEAMKKIKIIEHSERCPLCHNVVSIKSDTEDNNEEIEKALNQLQDKIETLNDLISIDKDKVLKITNSLGKLYQKKKIYIMALNEYQDNLETPYLAEIESINSMIKDYTTEKNKINSLIDIHNEVKENLSNLDRLNKEIDRLNKKKDKLLKLAEREDLILEKLNKKYRRSMSRFNFTDTQEDKCYISKETYLPYYNGISVLKHTSGCLLLCMQIAYLGAILELNIEEENNCHPGILFLDTVSNNIGTNSDSKDSIDPETYNELYKYLVELSDDNQNIYYR
ncbi:hypothetical protein AGR56_06070 [Clostridium sp. DMHC 10]|uniref:hypothetical protein n=1 Tax=Clostridium sp. DMHC 10 TaxID=747377 RepID=UPI00069D8461|nr:hypothetical protein [Clostridium sp. DMHC 10]KOF56377.1 hypothetical protein AGR56_06070 [Clostridium sp. DMHC 10]